MNQTSHPKKKHDYKAQGMVEFALILPILILMLLLIFDIGRSVYAYSVVHNAAREGARSGIVYPYNVGQAYLVVQDHTAVLEYCDPPVVGICDTVVNSFTDTFKVQVTYKFTAVTPLLGQLLGSPSNSITLVGQSIMTKEK